MKTQRALYEAALFGHRVAARLPRGPMLAVIIALALGGHCAMGDAPASITLTTSVDFTSVLQNGAVPFHATIGNLSGDRDSADWTVTNNSTAGLTLSGSGTELGAGESVRVTGLYMSAVGGIFELTAQASATNHATGTTAENSPAVSSPKAVVVGKALFADSGYDNLFSYNSTYIVKSVVAPNADLAGLSSYTVGDLTANAVGTTATILWGHNDATERIVSMNWRNRAMIETFPMMTTPPIPEGEYGAFSDVTEMTGLGDLPYVLSMTYAPDDQLVFEDGRTEEWYAGWGWIYLSWLDTSGSTPLWKNAVAGNKGGTSQFMGIGAWNSSMTSLGQWGVDTENNTVWAVLNHNSQFMATPEPTGLGMLAALAVGLLRRRRIAG